MGAGRGQASEWEETGVPDEHATGRLSAELHRSSRPWPVPSRRCLALPALLIALAASAEPGEGGVEVRSVKPTTGAPSIVELPCTAGALLRTSVEPDLQPLIVQLRDPSGELLAEARNITEQDDPVELPAAAVPTRSGLCQLTLSTASEPAGVVLVRIEPPRAPTPLDEMRIRAERLHQRAVVLWAEHAEHSLREALELATRAAALARDAGDARGESDVHATAAGIFWKLGELEPAEAAMTRAIEIRERLGNPRALAVAYNDRGVFRDALANSVQALEDLQRARELAEPLARPGLKAVILHNLGFNHMASRDSDRALELLRAAERAEPRPEQRGTTKDVIGAVLYDLKRYAEAEGQFRQALEAHRALGDSRNQAISLYHLGWVYGDTNRLAEARRAYREAIALLTPIGDRFNLAIAHDGLGEVLQLEGRWEEAVAVHAAALRLAQEAPDTHQQAVSLTNLAKSQRALGRLEESRDSLVQAVDLTDSGRLLRGGGSGRATWTAMNRHRYELLVSVLWDLQQRAPDPARPAEMFWISERARARSLLDLLLEARLDITRGADPELVASERRLLEEADRVSAEVARRTAAGARVPTDMPELRRVLTQLQEVRARMRQSNPRLAALARAEPLRLSAVQTRVLDSDTVLLQYLLGDDRSFVFVVTAASIDVRVLPGRQRIEREVHRLVELWQSPVSEPSAERRLASQLGGMLLEPARERIRGRRLAIAPDGILHELPFSALLSPRTRRRLVEEHELIHVPSASVVAAVRAGEHVARHSGAVAVLADPVFDRGDSRVRSSSGQAPAVVPADLQRSMNALGLQRLVRLPGTRLEAQGILALAPRGQSFAATGFEARRELALDPSVTAYRILHFATHGLLNSQHPELSGLVLSLVDPEGKPQNGFLRLQDIYGLRIDADLVVLSACQTALGKRIQGEGVIGVTRGFIHAGAHQVLASLWKVSDRGTAALMKELYRAMLVEGRRPPAALRQAQRKLARTRPFDGPYTWAAFVLQGDWEEIVHPPATEVRH